MEEKKVKEICVICGKETGYLKEESIEGRCFYVEGAGQLCRECFERIGGKGCKDEPGVQQKEA